MRETKETRRRGTATNIASGLVGIQAAQVTGSSVWIGVAPQTASVAGLRTELEAMRDLLARCRSVGSLDDITYDAATVELDIASKALEENTPEGRNKIVLALKRARGLVADVAELATKIGSAIAVVKGFS
jgi:adenosylhomocysteine nucleosidase